MAEFQVDISTACSSPATICSAGAKAKCRAAFIMAATRACRRSSSWPIRVGRSGATIMSPRYPDGFVICSPVSAQAKVVHDPVVIFEVLSETPAGRIWLPRIANMRQRPRSGALSSCLKMRSLERCSSGSMMIGSAVCWRRIRYWICPRSKSRFRLQSFMTGSTLRLPVLRIRRRPDRVHRSKISASPLISMRPRVDR